MENWKLQSLPLNRDVESKDVLRALLGAHTALAELRAVAETIPNQHILINTLTLQEAKDSSAVENIITTHDELYRYELSLNLSASPHAKEVQSYVSAVKRGYELIRKTEMLTTKSIIEIQQILEANEAGFRKLPGTTLKNALTGEMVYTPPQSFDEIAKLMSNLEQYINDDSLDDLDPLVKMSIIHCQFESIHPFYDGNGRTGRIINILYLIMKDLQTMPILYLSKYIINNKSDYYRLLQAVREEDSWEEWILFVIRGVEETAKETIALIKNIKKVMSRYKTLLRGNYKFYSHDLINNLFKHPYTKIEFLMEDINVSRVTAANYLNKLADDGLLRKEKIGTTNYYVNEQLFDLLKDR